jgi:hypothetical protein
MESLTVGAFQAELNEATGQITIRNGTAKLTLQTADAATVKQSVKFAASLFSVGVLPDVIRFSPLSVQFKEDGSAVLAKAGCGAVPFDRTNWEDLNKLVDMSSVRIADFLRIRGGPRAGVSAVNMPDPVLVGR